MIKDELACPSKLSVAGKKAHRIIVRFLRKHNITNKSDSRSFYSPAEWKARKERSGTDADLIVVYDGTALKQVFSGANATLYFELRDALNKAGLFIEHSPHESWYSYVPCLSGCLTKQGRAIQK